MAHQDAADQWTVEGAPESVQFRDGGSPLIVGACSCPLYQQDIGGVSLWPWTNTLPNIAMGKNIAVYLHTTANFSTDPAPVKCADDVDLITSFETYTGCPGAAGIGFVTLQRTDNSTAQLGLQEVAAYRSSGCLAVPCM